MGILHRIIRTADPSSIHFIISPLFPLMFLLTLWGRLSLHFPLLWTLIPHLLGYWKFSTAPWHSLLFYFNKAMQFILGSCHCWFFMFTNISFAVSDLLLIPSNACLISDIIIFISRRFSLGPFVFLKPQLNFLNVWTTVILPLSAKSIIHVSYGSVSMLHFSPHYRSDFSADLCTIHFWFDARPCELYFVGWWMFLYSVLLFQSCC